MENEDVSSEDMEKKKEMVLSMCTCPDCPSWVECGEKGGFCFQTIGKSDCIETEKGCICGACPVKEKMRLRHVYFCTRGSEKEQSDM